MKRPAAALAALLCAALLTACGGGDGFLLPPAPAAGELLPAGDPAAALAAVGAHAEGAAEWGRPEVDQETRPALITSTAGWSWRGRVPRGARLRFAVAAEPDLWRQAGPLTVLVTARHGREREIVQRLVLTAAPESAGEAAGKPGDAPPQDGPRWSEQDLDLSRRGGETVELRFSASFARLPAERAAQPVVAWAAVRLTGGGADAAEASRAGRPNVLVIVVDTLRADHLPFYGYERDTAPRLGERLAARGAVFEQAHSQAPWTLPSVLSYLTGYHPAGLSSQDMVRLGIPQGLPSLAERLRTAGYRTASFIANPTLHAGNGFARGFETFYTPPASTHSLAFHGDTLNRRVLPWLASHADAGPFFLYLHYIDPHDPYLSPDLVNGRSPFFPDYDGPVRGSWPHGLYADFYHLQDPQRDVRQLTALYDSEIVYADGLIGRVLDALPPSVLEDTLVVFTADHGEELYDHGWWKHGHTLYEEQLHVPFVVRWDGRVEAGRRIAAPVQLLDLVPTVLSAAGVEVPASMEGRNLLPALTGGGEPPSRRPAYAQHLASGPVRGAALLDDWKLVMFNRRAPYAPTDKLQATLARVSLERLARLELYNLSDDPAERHNLAAERPNLVERMAPLILGRLDAQDRPGLRVALGRVDAGSELAGEIVFERPPEGWWPEFLDDGDEVELAGRRLTWRWRGEPFAKGIRVLGDPGAVESVTVTVDGEAVPAARVAVGDGRPYAGGRLGEAALRAESWPPAAAAALAPAVYLWRPAAPAPLDAVEDDAAAEETARRLRALGYIQ